MTSLHQRNRIVVFRLSQDEYDRLRAACNAAGGRTLSDFTRSELLTLVETGDGGSGIERKFVEIDRKLSSLHTLVEHMSDRITALDGDRHDSICQQES
jgi:hypothetical protein